MTGAHHFGGDGREAAQVVVFTGHPANRAVGVHRQLRLGRMNADFAQQRRVVDTEDFRFAVSADAGRRQHDLSLGRFDRFDQCHVIRLICPGREFDVDGYRLGAVLADVFDHFPLVFAREGETGVLVGGFQFGRRRGTDRDELDVGGGVAVAPDPEAGIDSAIRCAEAIRSCRPRCRSPRRGPRRRTARRSCAGFSCWTHGGPRSPPSMLGAAMLADGASGPTSQRRTRSLCEPTRRGVWR